MAASPLSIAPSSGSPRYTPTTQDTMNTVPRLRLVPMPEPIHGPNDEPRHAYVGLDSLDLATRVVSGDELALDVLGERYANLLRRWARLRMSSPAPGQAGNPGQDVQEIIRTTTSARLRRLDERDTRREGTLLLVLRDAACKQLRSSHSRPTALDATIGRQGTDVYEDALERLDDLEREALVCVLEFQHSFEQLQKDLGVLSAEIARAMYGRAVVRLSEEMAHGR